MADSLFDNRYRYNYIYPRGRSGETLRAVDTQTDDRPVVIKRPAPNDAPPIRAGQEVSIVNEREALTRLAGHPILTELVGSGQFFVGGIPHQYIVMERADGIIVADEVIRLAGKSMRLPELEMLEIIDRLINLLQAAHDKDIVYNDVDAKHLFWNRETYTLKVIDWGNAVFLEGDEATMQGISRQTDVYQIGELLYFILSGGYRVDVPRDAGPDFRVDFHQDEDEVNPRLQEIISRAVHPNTRYRYTSLTALNADLSRYRSPLEQVRNAIVSRTINRLKNPNLTRHELLGLQTQLESALRQNPAYPVARGTHREIVDRLRDLEVSADLDAVKIYMENENWSRAGDVLNELRERTGSKTSGIVRLLLDWSLLLIDAQLESAPKAVSDAISLLFAYKPEKAANALLLDEPTATAALILQWRMAERITSHFSEILLLRPNLYRLECAVRQLGTDGIPIDEAQNILAGINQALDRTRKMEQPSAAEMRDIYGKVVEGISALHGNLQTLSLQHEFSERRLPLNALTRALNAAMSLADNMHVIGKGAANSPRDALAALNASRAIDPPNPVWEKIEDFLSHLYEVLQTSQTYVPAADGSDLATWLPDKHAELTPFARHLFDEMLVEILDSLEAAKTSWARYREVVVAGSRNEAADVLGCAAKSVATISPTLSNWFEQLRVIIEGAKYIERHSVPGHLGRTLADGWAAFDKGQLADAERLGQQAMELARGDSEKDIAQRLAQLSRLFREWVERNGVESESRTQKTLLDIENLFTAAENAAIASFASQMPSTDTYLKAMGQGLVGAFGNSNTAALRILFAQYVLSGVLDAHDGETEDARFWRAAASRCLPDAADRHASLRILDDYIERRQALLRAQELLNSVKSSEALGDINALVKELEANEQARVLAPAVHSLRTLEAAVQDWATAEFRAAGSKIDNALRGIAETESKANVSLASYRDWIMALQAAAAELSVKRRGMLQEIDRQPNSPQATIREAIHLQAETTEALLGSENAQMLAGWRDTYEQFLAEYISDSSRRDKLDQMNGFFKALLIERNPAYPLFRHWYRLIESMPDEPLLEGASPPGSAAPAPSPSDVKPEIAAAPEAAEAGASRHNPLLFKLGALIGAILVIGGLLSLAADGSFEQILAGIAQPPSPTALRPTATVPSENSANDDTEPEPAPDEISSAFLSALAFAPGTSSDASSDRQPPAAPAATDKPQPSATPMPTATDAPAATPLPTDTPAPTATATPALPPEGLTGAQDLLDLFSRSLAAPFWDESHFGKKEDSWRLGISGEGDGDTILLSLPPQLLDSAYGNDAPARIRRVEAELTLRSFNPAVVASDEVYFGILLGSAYGGDNAGLQVQAVGPNVINLARYQNGQADFVSQRSVNAVIARLRLDLDIPNGLVFAYFNDSQIGAGIPFAPAQSAAAPAIYVKDGGVIVGVSAWRVILD